MPTETGDKPSVTLFMIATGKYINYFLRVLPEIDQFLNPKKKIQIILLTDYEKEIVYNAERITLNKFYVVQEIWPDITLYRYHKILKYQQFIEAETLMWCDADMQLLKLIDTQEILQSSSLMLSKHPGFTFNWEMIITHIRRMMLTPILKFFKTIIVQKFSSNGWETNASSKAFVPFRRRRRYVQGGFWLGEKKEILKMCSILAQNIDADDFFGYQSVWNDESHLNWYAANYPVLTLPSGFVGVKGYQFLDQSNFHVLCLDKQELDSDL